MPSMPLNGVRSSWLMLARKALLAWLEASASARASRRLSATCCSSRRRRTRLRNWLTVSRAKARVSMLWNTVRPMLSRVWSRTASLRWPICSAISWLACSVSSWMEVNRLDRSARPATAAWRVSGRVAASPSTASCLRTKSSSAAMVTTWPGPKLTSRDTRAGCTSGSRLANSSKRWRTRSATVSRTGSAGSSWASRSRSRSCRNSLSSW